MNKHFKTAAILLGGGIGSRMKASLPKQFLKLESKPIILYSFDVFAAHPNIDEIVVVCAPEYQRFFKQTNQKTINFALPGTRRQDSVYNGFKALSSSANLICIHDGARPFIDLTLVTRVLEAAKTFGAATVGMPIKFTIKQSDEEQFVKSTPDRSQIWEIQTPQVLERSILQQGFDYVDNHNLTVTDDVSLAEIIGKKVKLVEGSHANLKITVPSDMAIASNILKTFPNASYAL